MSAVLDEVVVPDTAVLSTTLALDEGQRARLRRAVLIVAEAEAYTIDCAETAEMANVELKQTKVQAAELEKMKEDFVGPAKQILANALKWFRPTMDAYARKEQILKAKLVEWQRSEAERVAEENRAREAEARRLRAEAEAKAAAERARAEEAERKARQEAAIAEAAKLKAQREAEAARQAGDRAAAAEAERRAKAAAAEQAKKEEQERAAKAEGERKAAEATLAAAAAVAAQEPAPEPAKLAGFGTADNWVVELAVEAESDAIKLLAAAIGQRPELVAMLKIDWVAARRQGTSLKKLFNIPGLKCTNQPKAVSRK